MTSADLPVQLEQGEWLLQWSVSTFGNRLQIVLRQGRLWMVLSVLGAVFAFSTLICLAAVLDLRALAVVLAPIAAVAIFVAAVVPYVVVAVLSPPKPWWVTTRRLIVGGRGGPREFRLADFTGLDSNNRFVARLTFGEETHRLAPVIALPELWGSLILGRALATVDLPPVDADRAEPSASGFVAWYSTARQGSTTATGVLVFFPDAIVWLPATTISLGDRISEAAAQVAGALVGMSTTTIRPNPPFDPLFHRLMRVRDPADFRPGLDLIIERWGGFTVSGNGGAAVTPGPKGANVTLEIGAVTYKAVGISHPEWPEVSAALGLG